MGFEIARIQGRTATCEMPVDGDTVTLTYYPVVAGAVSQTDLTELADACKQHPGDPRAQRRLQAEFARPLFAAWSLTSGGEPYPLTVDTLAELDPAFIAQMIAAAIEHVNVGKVSGAAMNKPGTATTSPTVGGESGPTTTTPNRASRRRAKSQR